MKQNISIKTLIEQHLRLTGESPDKLAERSGVSRAVIFRIKNGASVNMSTMQKLVDAIGLPLVIEPQEHPHDPALP